MTMYRMDELEITTNDLGEEIVTLDIDSNTLPHLNVDTYQCFNGDSWLEYEQSYHVEERGFPDKGWELWDYTYDHAGINKGLAEASIDSFINCLPMDEIIESVEYVSSYSPRYYNFETDSYRATYVVNRTKLNAWIAEQEIDLHEYAKEHYTSYDGFHSFVTGYLLDPEREEGTLFWLAINAYIRSELNEESYFLSVAEAEHEIYSENVTAVMQDEPIKDALVALFEDRTPSGEYTEDWVDQLLAESGHDEYRELFKRAEDELEQGYHAQWETIIGACADILTNTAVHVQIEGQESLPV